MFRLLLLTSVSAMTVIGCVRQPPDSLYGLTVAMESASPLSKFKDATNPIEFTKEFFSDKKISEGREPITASVNLSDGNAVMFTDTLLCTKQETYKYFQQGIAQVCRNMNGQLIPGRFKESELWCRNVRTNEPIFNIFSGKSPVFNCAGISLDTTVIAPAENISISDPKWIAFAQQKGFKNKEEENVRSDTSTSSTADWHFVSPSSSTKELIAYDKNSIKSLGGDFVSAWVSWIKVDPGSNFADLTQVRYEVDCSVGKERLRTKEVKIYEKNKWLPSEELEENWIDIKGETSIGMSIVLGVCKRHNFPFSYSGNSAEGLIKGAKSIKNLLPLFPPPSSKSKRYGKKTPRTKSQNFDNKIFDALERESLNNKTK